MILCREIAGARYLPPLVEQLDEAGFDKVAMAGHLPFERARCLVAVDRFKRVDKSFVRLGQCDLADSTTTVGEPPCGIVETVVGIARRPGPVGRTVKTDRQGAAEFPVGVEF